MDINYAKYLPLSEATFYVLAALREPLHGYALMQKVEAMSEGNVVIGPGTLYGAFAALEKQALIEKLSEIDRRKTYGLTDKGRLVLAGPHPAIDAETPGDAGFSGSLVVAEFESLDDAQAWADADPYVAAGVYAKVLVNPFKKVLP